MPPNHISRRKLLMAASSCIVAWALPSAANALIPSLSSSKALLPHPNRELKLYNSHTGEKIKIIYCEHGQYITEHLQQLNLFLRDHRSGASIAMHTALLDALFLMKETLNYSNDIRIISGYRSKETNAMLRKNSTGVAKNSFHTRGKAIDIQLPNISLKQSYRLARQLKFGGVGLYERSGFIHLDTGPIRHWSG